MTVLQEGILSGVSGNLMHFAPDIDKKARQERG
jgi:hypothetical protein